MCKCCLLSFFLSFSVSVGVYLRIPNGLVLDIDTRVLPFSRLMLTRGYFDLGVFLDLFYYALLASGPNPTANDAI